MLTCKVGETIINCFDGKYDKYTLKMWSDKNILRCPVCNSTYEYCHGEYVSPYFRHKEKECEGYYSEPETEEHMQGKIKLYHWIKEQPGVDNCKLEAWIPETKQRPDIYFEYEGKRFVIEFQCTPIASEYSKRKELYRLAGINDIWILGINKYAIEIDKNGNPFHNDKYKVIENEITRLMYFDSRRNVFISNSSILPINKEFRQVIHNVKLNSDIVKFDLFDKYLYGDFFFTERIDNFKFVNEIRINEGMLNRIEFIKEKYIEESNKIETQKNIIKSKIRNAQFSSKFVGDIGEIINVLLVLVEKKSFTSFFKTRTTFYKFIDNDGNIYIWYTTTNQTIRIGDLVRLCGTIKSHDMFKDVQQTTLTRCKINDLRGN